MKRDYVVFGIVVVLVAIVSFVSGDKYAMATRSRPAAANQTAPGNFGGGGGRGFRRMRPVVGQVTAVNGTTLTLKTAAGSNVNVSLASNPTVTDSNGGSVAADTIKTGDTIAVFGTTGSDGTITAQRVRLNPPAASGANPPAGV